VYTQREPVDVGLMSVQPLVEEYDAVGSDHEISCKLADVPLHQDSDDDATSQHSDTSLTSACRSSNTNASRSSRSTGERLDPIVGQTNSTQEESDDVVVPAACPVPAPPAPAPTRRIAAKKMKFAKQKVYAGSSFYLDVDVTNGIPAPASSPELLGTIINCPNKKNDYCYRMRWDSTTSGDPVPTDLSSRLCVLFPKIRYHNVLTQLVLACPLNTKNDEATATRAATNNNNTPAHDDMPQDLRTPATTSGPSQDSSFAAILTAAGSSSAVSSLSVGVDTPSIGVTGRQTRNRSTRSTRSQVEPDSDDSMTDDEDEYQVDFSENFWESRRETQRIVDEAEDEPDELVTPQDDFAAMSDDDEEASPSQSNDYARLLRPCTDFIFEEMTAEEAQQMMDPPQVYQGERGLKQGVAALFTTPLEALRQSGLSERMVSHWTYNSNL
jgi:hypothetical protein